MRWQEKLLTADRAILDLIERTRRIAVLGIKTEQQASQPAYYVPRHLQEEGFRIVPVPVYFPEVTQIMGEPVYRRLQDIPGALDLVNVFRRPADVATHLDDLLAKQPHAVWLQLGIRNDAVAETLARAGIFVVQDRCLMVDQQRLAARRAG